MSVVKLPIKTADDLYVARRSVGELAAEIGFSSTIQVQICTAVSEIVRNVLHYADEGGIQARQAQSGIAIEIWDTGPGIPLEIVAAIEAGTYKSKTGMGKGINGAKRLMDKFRIVSLGRGTQVFMEKNLVSVREKGRLA
jgi:serine/threonine-protein kinase RsbT